MNDVQLKYSLAEVLDEAKVAVLKRNLKLKGFIKNNGDQITDCFIIAWQDLLLKIRKIIVEGVFPKHEITTKGVHGSTILKYPPLFDEYKKIKDIQPIKEIALNFFEPLKIKDGYFPETTYSFECYDVYNENIIEFIRGLIKAGIVRTPLELEVT